MPVISSEQTANQGYILRMHLERMRLEKRNLPSAEGKAAETSKRLIPKQMT